jgi:hypothetical protein
LQVMIPERMDVAASADAKKARDEVALASLDR